LIVLGRDMFDLMDLKTRNPNNISIIENWADVENIIPKSFDNNPIILNHNLKDKIVFLFAGNMGRLQGLEFIIDLLSEVRNPKIHFLFVGNGAVLPILEKKKQELGL